MADPISILTAAAGDGCPSLNGYLSTDWGAHAPDFRERIRQHLKTHLNGPASWMDLRSPPEATSEWSVSISHARQAGGWMAIRRPFKIGFDIEELVRIESPVITRICSPAELRECPDLRLLWLAKEAFFKTLFPDHQPQLISQTRIASWRGVARGLYAYRAYRADCDDPDGIDRSENLLSGKGWVLSGDSHGYAVCVAPPAD